MVLLAYFNAVVSMDRIEMFLNSEERDENVVIRNDPAIQEGTLIIKDGKFAWESLNAAIHNEKCII